MESNIISVNSDSKLAPSDFQEYVDLKKHAIWVLATIFPLMAINIVIGIMSNSLTMFSVAVDYAGSLILHIFNIASILVIMRRNAFNFPYGTGKLENFSGFLYGIIIIPMTLVIMYFALHRFLHPPEAINLGTAQIAVLLGAIRAWWLFAWASRLCRRYPDYSPMTHSYYVNFRLSLIKNISIIACLFLALGFASAGYLRAAVMVDLFIGVAVAWYIFYCAVGVLIKNFRSLIDLPLPEADQHKILKAMVEDFDTYEGIGNIYTQLSGSTRFVQMELYFNPETTVEEIESLRMRLEGKLKEHFSKLVFHLIPLVRNETQ